MKKFLFISFFIFPFIAFSRQSKTDSLLQVLKTTKEDTVKISILNSLSWEIMNKSDYEHAMQYADEALIICENEDPKSGAIKKLKSITLTNIGTIFWNKGNYSKAIEFHFKSLEIKEELGDKKGMAACYNNIGVVYDDKGDYAKAIEYYLKSLKIKEELGDKKGMAASYNNIGNIHYSKEEFEQAIEFYFKSLKIREEINDKKGIAACYNNIGNIHYYKKDYDGGIGFYLKSLKIREELGDKQGMAMSYGNMGNIYDDKGEHSADISIRDENYSLAIQYFLKSLKIKQEIGDMQGMAMTYNNLGNLYVKQSKTKEARNELFKSLNISKEIQEKPVMMYTYLSLSSADSADGNFKSAYEYHKLYAEIKDSIFNEESSKQIAEMQTKYETEKKELQIENLNKDNKIKSSEIKKQNIQKIAFASGFMLMLILAFVIFRGYRQKQRANKIISSQKTEVEKQKEIVDEKNKSLEVAYKHIEEKNTEILDSIRYAKRIQEAILPPQKLIKSYLENSFILYKPKDIVAGDFYWMENVDGKILFASVDCTGHGVPGAFMSILGYNGLNRCVKEFGLTQPAAILDKLCELVDEAFSKSESDIKDGMDIALVNLDLKGFENLSGLPLLQYAGAGNSLYNIRNGILSEYSPDKQPIGKFAYRKPFTNHEIQLQKNDAVYIFTDGYADQFGGPKGKKFKYSQFEKLLLSMQEKTMWEQREILNNAIEEWRGELEQIDDICIIGVRV